jgi:hypothetical protein
MKEFLDYFYRTSNDDEVMRKIYDIVRAARPSTNRTMILEWYDKNWFSDPDDNDGMGPMPYEFGDK